MSPSDGEGCTWKQLLRGPPHVSSPEITRGVGTDETKLKQHITARQTVNGHNEVFWVTAALKNSSKSETN